VVDHLTAHDGHVLADFPITFGKRAPFGDFLHRLEAVLLELRAQTLELVGRLAVTRLGGRLGQVVNGGFDLVPGQFAQIRHLLIYFNKPPPGYFHTLGFFCLLLIIPRPRRRSERQ
jgi:hypothetical protein